MFLEVGYKRVGGGMVGGSEVSHKRAALDFVAELTGSPRAGGEKKGLELHNDASYVHADELPVPMFGVDMNLRCTFWNRRATDATGWTETEVFAMPKFTASLFSNQSDNEKDCEELLKAALEGQDSINEMWSLKTKWGKDMNAVLMANARSDNMGVTCGVVCVIMPLTQPKMEQPSLKLDCNVSAMDHMSILDLEEEQLNSYGSSSRSEDLFLAALEQPPSPYFDGSVRDTMDMYGDPTNTFYEAEGSSICSQDWCKSEQSSDSSKGNTLERSSLTQARAMVVDPDDRGRKSLNLMLERCGFEVSCVTSGDEALWTFEQSMQDPEGFSIVFVNLHGARSDDYALIRQLRNLEASASSPNITTQVVIVAITNLDRWQDSTQKDISAGLDAIINYPLRVQQLRDTLNSLGVQIDHLDFANKSPRASFNSWNNPLILAR
ncbi:hypothetical protein M758_1G042900 [Ceratodon purpureus]|nr:hypothetical protein M758_1G042900 [Ceratodon purpureus]